MGLEQSRRDDLECLMYVLVFLLRGSLPWCGYQAMTRQEKYIHIKDTKMHITPLDLCRGLPEELGEITMYVRSMGFTDKPRYAWMLDLLKQCLKRHDGTLGRLAFPCAAKPEKKAVARKDSSLKKV